MKRIVGFWPALTLAVCVQAGCGSNTSSNASAGEAPDGQGSEIATSVVSAAAREDLQHICVRICGTLNIIEVFAGG
jgi:hypothetical protein